MARGLSPEEAIDLIVGGLLGQQKSRWTANVKTERLQLKT
jgi:hypothetical protein